MSVSLLSQGEDTAPYAHPEMDAHGTMWPILRLIQRFLGMHVIASALTCLMSCRILVVVTMCEPGRRCLYILAKLVRAKASMIQHASMQVRSMLETLFGTWWKGTAVIPTFSWERLRHSSDKEPPRLQHEVTNLGGLPTGIVRVGILHLLITRW
ncbi:hypothetical protein PYCCODRAFT_681502 [Trametes coccinea BRFM310]|uniref:Uncharacterized protein n=1 Tax=Trametes coccinea (strain BRFM310) TaxID=1353009 RepID=A0A1Y2IIT2_TRAC3|nr:hypothetical protein PYCCODRAFT_681502 [Trametes coccinea BRFM310]